MIVLSVFKRFVMFSSPLEEIHTHLPQKQVPLEYVTMKEMS